MNNFISKIERLQRALAELSPARRLLAGALVAVMLATGVWAISRATSSSSSTDPVGGAMEPVLDQTFAEADIARIVKHLDAKGVDHKIEGGKVLVAASERLDVLSDLFYAGILGGSGKSSGFDAMVKQMTPWDPPSKTDKMFNRYREEKVEEVISRYPGVRKTTVVIDPTNERHFGGESIVPTAMVDIQTRGEGTANPRQLSQAAVNVLTGVIANLSRDRVRVTIDGATFNSGSDSLKDGSGIAGDLSERKQKAEQLHVAKVRQLLSYIPGDVLVSVSVDLDVPVVADDADGSAKPQADNAEVVANAVPMIPDATKTTTPLRTESVRSASVAVPRTYFVKIYRRANSGTQEPTDALLQPVVDAYSLKIRNLVKNALGLEHDDAVTVEQYDDALPAAIDAAVAASSTVAPTGAATAGAASPPVAAITRNLNTYAREIAFVTLGAVVVTALSLIVRRRNPRQAVMVDAHGRQHLGGEHEIINGTLEDVMDDDDDDDDDDERGHGGDPHQLFRRVRDMAQEHPDDAARVLRSWIYQQD